MFPKTRMHTYKRRKARPRQIKSAGLYARLFPLLQEKIALLDQEENFCLVSPAFEQMLEMTAPASLEGRPISNFLDPEVALQFQSVLYLMKMNERQEEQAEVDFVTASGNRIPARVSIKFFQFGGISYTFLDVEDLGAWKATQNELMTTRLELELSYSAILTGWARTLEIRDIETKGHCDRVANLMADLALHMGFQLEETLSFRNGAIMHDVGKIGITDSILFKPGPLTDEEWALMKQHPVIARNLLGSIDYLKSSLAIPYSHHEKWDGSGYPQGLKGEAIPIEARMFAVIDVWDALTHDRPYRAGWPREKVRAYIQENAGTYFDPAIVKVFLELI